MNRHPETVSFWRGRLPHWEVVDGRYFITIHLSGAIPETGQERIHELAVELNHISRNPKDAGLKLQRRVFLEMEAWLDRAGTNSHFDNPAVSSMVMEAIAFRNHRIWNVFEYVLMPSHIHLFLELLEPGLKHHLEQFKRWTGHRAARLLDLDADRFWQDEWFDHWSRSDEQDEQIIRYIRRNPEKAGLVKSYQDWPYGGWRRGGIR